MVWSRALGALFVALLVGAAGPVDVDAHTGGHSRPLPPGLAKNTHAQAARAPATVLPTPAPAPAPTAAPPILVAPVRQVARPAPIAPRPQIAPPLPVVEPVTEMPPAVALAPPATAAPAPIERARINPAAEGFPEYTVPKTPAGGQVLVTLALLPLLVAVWLWALVRAGVAAWRQRGSAIRSAVAHQLGLRADQLAALDVEGLRRLRDGIAFDELTGVLRRAAGLAALERELARAARGRHPVSVAFIDVDGLKAVNDTRGHAAGDALLRGVANVLTRRLRAQDLVFRYGGDEFVCVMPGTSRPRAEATVAEMRQMATGGGLPFSFGVAQAAAGESARTVISRADSLQYLDKQARRASR